MRLYKRGIALLLAAMMLITPAFAADVDFDESDEAAEIEQLEEQLEQQPEEPQNAETVIYNLGEMEVTVGEDAGRAEEEPWQYKLFDEDGGYTIELEENAFFPYEVQFQYDGKTTTKWFETPDSEVEINGHVFSVYSEQTDPYALTQIGVQIGEEYVAAWPEEKDFSAEPGISLFSMMPLEEENFQLNLKTKLPAELKNVTLSTVLAGKNVDEGKAVVWASDGDDDFQIANGSTAIDLRDISRLELIVGTEHQLDTTNTRYIIYVEKTYIYDMFDAELYAQPTDGQRTKIELDHTSWYDDDEMSELYLRAKSNISTEDALYLGLTLSDDFKDDFSSRSFKAEIYADAYESMDQISAAGAKNITASILDQTMTRENAGYSAAYADDYPEFTLVLSENGNAVMVQPFYIYCSSARSHTGFSYRLKEAAGENGYSISSSVNSSLENGVRYRNYTVSEDDAASAYRWCMSYTADDQPVSVDDIGQYVTKAVVGIFDTLDAASSAEDVKATLFGDGYQDSFSGEGVSFTIFMEDGSIEKYNITVSVVPETRSADTYFEVTGAQETSKVYVMPYEHDTYYTNGFQTVLTTADVDLSALKPNFNIRKSGVHIYADGKQQQSGSSEHDFSEGPVQYSAAAENGTTLKNYWVTFVKKQTGGAKLFVNGINGSEGAKREVFLNSMYDYRHDIFIANIGDQPLTGLKAELTDAVNIKLDEYWTVGGDGNNTLAAFTSTAQTKRYGELANTAKIRLLPNGEGEISGTLTISADGQEPVVITLTGTAGDPKIMTTAIPNAVKYVPYGALIQTNNMYDWNTVSFEVIDGALPSGMEIRPNGEIYGVPTETGDFTFTVRMENSYYGFSDSEAEFTLTVLENTDPNVDNSTDAGYEVLIRVPDQTLIDSNGNHTLQGEEPVFKTAGSYTADFMDFWMDGEKLTEGVDYTIEEGSTVITIRSQTISKAGAGTHTIAAEYRPEKNVDNELKRAAQNFNVNIKGSGGSSSKPSSKPSSSGSGSSHKTSTGKKDETETTKPKPVEEYGTFLDVPKTMWCYTEVEWANKEGLMIGNGKDMFYPNDLISQATVLATLSRMANVDLTVYNSAVYPDIPANQWYTASANWAKANGLLGSKAFSALPPMSRAELAKVIYRYLQHLGIAMPENVQVPAFADEAQMTQEEKEVFRTLYALGIFKGKGNNLIDPNGSTTRAELAALLHRIDVFVKSVN